jgi:hypothetical protein
MTIKESDLLILDRVFQHYLEYNDNDEEARDLYYLMVLERIENI